jgi:hypothetical protein
MDHFHFRAFQLASGMYLAFYVVGHMDSVFILARTYLGIDTDWAFATGAPQGLIRDPWNVRLVPHYWLGVFFVLSHLSSGLRVVVLAHGWRKSVADWIMIGGSLIEGLVATPHHARNAYPIYLRKAGHALATAKKPKRTVSAHLPSGTTVFGFPTGSNSGCSFGPQVWPRLARLISALRQGARRADRSCTSCASASRFRFLLSPQQRRESRHSGTAPLGPKLTSFSSRLGNGASIFLFHESLQSPRNLTSLWLAAEQRRAE